MMNTTRNETWWLKNGGNRPLPHSRGRYRTFILFTSLILLLPGLASCNPPKEALPVAGASPATWTFTPLPADELEAEGGMPSSWPATGTFTPRPTQAADAVDYTPLPWLDWPVSTPAEQGLDPILVAALYSSAVELKTLYGLLIIKDGYLIAEGYFNQGSLEQEVALASVTKSYVSALVGIALDQGCLSGVDQKMVDFFPEYAGRIADPRKEEITIGDMLKMRSGYPWEEDTPPYLDRIVSSGNWLPFIVEFPLTSDPGTEFGYSNLTAHLLGVIVARACETDLRTYGQEDLFRRINAGVGYWPSDANGYYYGSGDISFNARDAAKFGLLYLNGGEYHGRQIVPSDWVGQSLQTYSEGMFGNRLGSYLRDIGYGYLWWSARAGSYHFNYAWGHGGNLIVLLDELDMVIVTTADPLHGLWGQASWTHEGAIIDLVGEFIASLPD
jgi:CubicO group peptidase (beta-lactamase class C family)